MIAREIAWLLPRSDTESAMEDVRAATKLTPEQRVAEAAMLSRVALSLLDHLPADERRRIVREQEPLSPAHEAAWCALVRRSHGA